MTEHTCWVDGCGRRVNAHGLCPMHLWRLKMHGDLDHTKAVQTAEERFWLKVDKDGPLSSTRADLGPCWLWTAYKNKSGYGYFTVKSRPPGKLSLPAHRYAWMAVGNTLSGPDEELDHLCHDPTACALGNSCPHRACVNPAHLEAVTPRQNVLRSGAPTAQHASRTHCPQGHPYDEVNTYVDPTGARHCRTCARAWQRAFKARRRTSQAATSLVM